MAASNAVVATVQCRQLRSYKNGWAVRQNQVAPMYGVPLQYAPWNLACVLTLLQVKMMPALVFHGDYTIAVLNDVGLNANKYKQ